MIGSKIKTHKPKQILLFTPYKHLYVYFLLNFQPNFYWKNLIVSYIFNEIFLYLKIRLCSFGD